jgi:hypothetical protein
MKGKWKLKFTVIIIVTHRAGEVMKIFRPENERSKHSSDTSPLKLVMENSC